jgi:hypothetical protein
VPDQRQPEHRNDFVSPDLPPSRERQTYTIRRKGSRYNIFGPRGRVFPHFKSASEAGPRWEELTGTPWPYRSAAYESGLRLWQLGQIPREHVGQLRLLPAPPVVVTAPEPVASRPAPAPRPIQKAPVARKNPVTPIELPHVAVPLMLPAPRIDLQEQARAMADLRRDPHLLFEPRIRVALHNEVDYHLPQARWARKLLSLLDHYDSRQRRQTRATHLSEETIMARHIAWQEEQRAAATVTAAAAV